VAAVKAGEAMVRDMIDHFHNVVQVGNLSTIWPIPINATNQLHSNVL
jgi:hypothetical protein